jgi:hypothetical protein
MSIAGTQRCDREQAQEIERSKGRLLWDRQLVRGLSEHMDRLAQLRSAGLRKRMWFRPAPASSQGNGHVPAVSQGTL